MKITLFILSILVSFFSISAKSYNLSFKVIDGYTNKSIAVCTISIVGEHGELIYQGNTDGDGRLAVENLADEHLLIICRGEKDYFFEKTMVFKNKKKLNEHFIFHLYPTPKYESLMFQIEDSIYGPVIKGKDTDSTDMDENRIIDALAAEATFYGGAAAMQAFISNNVFYPQESIELGEEGRVYLEFVVEKNGVISHVIVVKGASLNLNNEAKRLARSMPNWVAGQSAFNQHVRTLCRLPIIFNLE